MVVVYDHRYSLYNNGRITGRNAVTARTKKLAAEEKGAEIMFRRLSEVAKLTSRDMNVLTLRLREINKTEALVDYYEANKERLL